MIRRCAWIAIIATSLGAQCKENPFWLSKNYSTTLTSKYIKVEGYFENNKFKAILEIVHAAKPNETFTLNIRILEASKFRLLNLDEFAGPGSLAGKKKVLTIKSASMKTEYAFFGEGGFTAEHSSDEFTIDLATPRDKHKLLFQLLNVASKNTEAWTIKIVSPKNSNQYVMICFNFIGAHDYLRSYLR